MGLPSLSDHQFLILITGGFERKKVYEMKVLLSDASSVRGGMQRQHYIPVKTQLLLLARADAAPRPLDLIADSVAPVGSGRSQRAQRLRAE
jgi:hypothetical protein